MALAVSSEAKQKGIDWLYKLHDAGDSLDAEAFASKFTEKATVNFGEQPPVVGRAAIEGHMRMQFSMLKSMKHTVDEIDILPDKIYQSTIVRYVVKGDPKEEEITVKAFGIFYKGLEDEEMNRFDVYGDFSKLTGRIMEVLGAGSK